MMADRDERPRALLRLYPAGANSSAAGFPPGKSPAVGAKDRGSHEVDARMMPQNAPAALSSEAAGAFSAPERAMANAAEALSLTSASAIGFMPWDAALITARRRHDPA
ncbi:MAG TPA: hypothetical protein VN106_11390, partial [Sphingomicrobium sp.]|nr:hypothetical protein [Sphingomicrobium sp.]